MKNAVKTEHPILFSAPMVQAILEGRKTQTRRTVKGDPLLLLLSGHSAEEVLNDKIPYGNPGDRLWVRETWTKWRHKFGEDFLYRADFENGKNGHIWKPSIHMPRVASRITLLITGIRVERLHDITEADAVAEGCQSGGDWGCAPTIQFEKLWESINGRESWDENPWVWVIEFKKL